MKVAFFITITSARRVGELGAQMAHPPYTTFYKDKMILRPHPKFIAKVASPFHLNQHIYLPVFFPKPHADHREASPHMLNVDRPLAFYLQRIKTFRKSSCLFLSITEQLKGQTITKQRLSKWILGCIHLCYQQSNLPAPPGVRTHSTRALSTGPWRRPLGQFTVQWHW